MELEFVADKLMLRVRIDISFGDQYMHSMSEYSRFYWATQIRKHCPNKRLFYSRVKILSSAYLYPHQRLDPELWSLEASAKPFTANLKWMLTQRLFIFSFWILPIDNLLSSSKCILKLLYGPWQKWYQLINTCFLWKNWSIKNIKTCKILD